MNGKVVIKVERFIYSRSQIGDHTGKQYMSVPPSEIEVLVYQGNVVHVLQTGCYIKSVYGMIKT